MEVSFRLVPKVVKSLTPNPVKCLYKTRRFWNTFALLLVKLKRSTQNSVLFCFGRKNGWRRNNVGLRRRGGSWDSGDKGDKVWRGGSRRWSSEFGHSEVWFESWNRYHASFRVCQGGCDPLWWERALDATLQARRKLCKYYSTVLSSCFVSFILLELRNNWFFVFYYITFMYFRTVSICD